MVYIKDFLLIYNQVFSAKDERSDMKASMFMCLIHMMGQVWLSVVHIRGWIGENSTTR